MRVDYGNTSVITDPANGKTIVLDHIRKEVRTIAAPQAGAPQIQLPGIPAPPVPPAPPTAPAINVKELGKRFVEGQEVEGRQYTLPPKPALPNQPQPPALVSEVWTSTALQLPVLTRITGSFGQQICRCKNAVAAEPHPSLFQIPPDYKPVER